MTPSADARLGRRCDDASMLFDRVVVGVDGSEPGFEACRQAAVLTAPSGSIEAVAVVDIAEAIHAGLTAPLVAERLASEGETALARATEILGDRARTRLVDGSTTKALLHQLARVDATMLAVGTHGHARATEIVIGGVAGELLHTAPCSILVARPPADTTAFPASIVVGIDGSDEANAALAVAEKLASWFDVPLRVLLALGGKNVEVARALEQAPLLEEIDEQPVRALVEASSGADLVIVGSRGLHGVRALGSVSERVAHQAACSVLVVRRANGP